MWGCLLFLIVCLSPLVSSEEEPCPTNIQPCTCSHFVGYPPSISCSRIADQAVLQDVFNRSDEPFPEFYLVEANVKCIPSRALIQKNTLTMIVELSTLYNLFDYHPVENHKMTQLKWKNSRLLCGNLWKQMQPLKELQYLFVEGIPDVEIGKAFEQSISPTLEKFIVRDTDTKKLSPTVFQKLVNLKLIAFSMTRLSTLKRSMFPEKNRIEVFNFRHNMITSLPDDMFSNMPSLKEVNLSVNQLKTFSEAVFGPLLDLPAGVIYIGGNRISCDCSIKWFLYKYTQVRVEGECDNPKSRKGRDFRELRRDSFSYCPNSVPMLLETSI